MKYSTKLQAPQRHQRIIDRIRERGFVTVLEMAKECHVSDMTMRRDLDHLAEENIVERTHGGATSREGASAQLVDLIEPALHERTESNRPEKALIARAAAELIENGQTVALDIGSTTFELAHAIINRPINVYTNSLKIATFLNQHRPNVYLPAGKLFGTEPSIIGTLAVEHFVQLNFDIVFIGVSGVSEGGFFDYSLEDSEVKRALISCAQKRVILMDSSKFNRMSVIRVSAFEDIDLLITDAQPPENLMKKFTTSGIEVLIAE